MFFVSVFYANIRGPIYPLVHILSVPVWQGRDGILGHLPGNRLPAVPVDDLFLIPLRSPAEDGGMHCGAGHCGAAQAQGTHQQDGGGMAEAPLPHRLRPAAGPSCGIFQHGPHFPPVARRRHKARRVLPQIHGVQQDAPHQPIQFLIRHG